LCLLRVGGPIQAQRREYVLPEGVVVELNRRFIRFCSAAALFESCFWYSESSLLNSPAYCSAFDPFGLCFAAQTATDTSNPQTIIDVFMAISPRL
jgi:hypothetical protein